MNMKTKCLALVLFAYSSVQAQEVFTNGVDVNGQMVQGVGLMEVSPSNLAWTAKAPALGQLAGVDSNGNDIAESYLVPLRPAYLETDAVYARTTNGLTLFDNANNAVLKIQGGAVTGNGSALTNLNASAFTAGRVPVALLPTGGCWQAGGLIITNVQVQGTVPNPPYYNVSSNSTVIGNSASGGTMGTALGWMANGYNGVAIGVDARGYQGLGVGSSAYGNYSGVAVGTTANGQQTGVAVGQGANGYMVGVAIGEQANGQQWGLAIGQVANGRDVGVAIGGHAQGQNYGLAIGYAAVGTNDAIAIGSYAQAEGRGSLALGSDHVTPTWAAATSNTTDAIQLGRTGGAGALMSNKVFRVWGGAAAGGLTLDGNTGTLSVSNLVLTGLLALPAQGDVGMGSYTNQP